MSFLGSIGGLVGGLLGGSAQPAPQINFTPVGFSGGGLNASFNGNSYGVTADPSRSYNVGGISNTFSQQADALGGLAQQWSPGFSNLRQTQLDALNANRAQAIGNLSQNLAQRRVLGSSFAQNSLTSADQTYQQQIAQTMAQSYLQELAANQQIIQAQYTAARGKFQAGLDEMNLEANLAANLTGQANQSMSQIANAQAQLDAKAAAGAGSFFGNIGTQLGSVLGSSNALSSISSLFGGGTGAAVGGAGAAAGAAGGVGAADAAGGAAALGGAGASAGGLFGGDMGFAALLALL